MDPSLSTTDRRHSVEWHCPTSPWKKYKATISAGSHCCCFWNAEGVIVVDIMTHAQTINSDLYTHALSKHFRTVWPHKNVTGFLLQHDNAPTHVT